MKTEQEIRARLVFQERVEKEECECYDPASAELIAAVAVVNTLRWVLGE